MALINIRYVEEICILDLPKDIFYRKNINLLKNTIKDILSQDRKTIILNMEKVSRINNTGLTALLDIDKISIYNDTNIKLFNIQPQTEEMLHLTRLNKILNICKNADDFCEQINNAGVLIA